MELEHGQASSRIGVHRINDVLIVPVKSELDDDSVKRLQQEVVENARETSLTGALIDMSAVRVLDSFAFSILAETARMVSLLGKKPVFVGFQAGVASALVDLEVDLDGITTALTMEDGLELLRSLAPPWKRGVPPPGEGLDDEAGRGKIEEEERGNELAGEDEGDHDPLP